MVETYEHVYDRVEKLLGKHKNQILQQLPFNPRVLVRAFEEIKQGDGNFNSWGKIFEGDPGLQTRFLYEANLVIKEKRKDQWKIRSMNDAISVLGQRRTVVILEKALADDVLEKFKRLDYREYDLIWHECYYMATIGRRLAPHFDIAEHEGYALCLLANIGHIVMAQVYDYQYLHDIIRNEERIRNHEYNILHAERAEYNGITHADVGYWFLRTLGIDIEFATAAYRHEFPEPSTLKSNRHQLVAYANKLSAYFTRSYLIEKILSATYSDEEIERENEKLLPLRKKTINMLREQFGLSWEKANQFLRRVELDVEHLLSNRKSSERSILSQSDYISALEELGESKNEVLDKMLSSLDLSIAKYLPYPLAIDYFRLQENQANRKFQALEIPTLVTSIVQNYTTLMSSIILAFLYRQRPDQLLEELLKLKEPHFYLSMGKAVNICTELFSTIAGNFPADKIPDVIHHFLRLKNKIYELCRLRAEAKNISNIVELSRAIELTNEILKDYALQQPDILAVTDIEYFEASEGKNELFRIGYISWNGTESLEARHHQYFRSPKGLPKGSQMLILRERGKNIYRLPKFLTFRADPVTLRSHFYHANSITLQRNAGRCTVFMQPYNSEAAKDLSYTFSLPPDRDD